MFASGTVKRKTAPARDEAAERKRKTNKREESDFAARNEPAWPLASFTRIQLKAGGSYVDVRRTLPLELRVNDALFNVLWALHPPQLGVVMRFGELTETKRWQKSYLHDYHFSGANHVGDALPHDFLRTLLAWVIEQTGLPYAQLLINWYENGDHYISSHSDDENQLVKASSIFSFVFGPAERRFVITRKAPPGEKLPSGKKTEKELEILMHGNMLLIMGGAMQEHYKHGVPQQPKCRLPRINVTVRLFECCQQAFNKQCELVAESLPWNAGLNQSLAREIALYTGCPKLR